MYRILLILIFSTLAFCINAKSQKVYLGFKQQSFHLEENKVNLERLVYFQGENEKIIKLKALSLALKSDLVEHKMIITEIVKSKLLSVDELHWRGALKANIRMDNLSARKEMIGIKAKSVLKSFLENRFRKVEVVVSKRQTDWGSELDFERLRIRDIERLRVNKRISVWVELISGKEVVRQIPVWFEVKVFDEVLVSHRSINKYETIKSDFFYSELREVTGSHKKTLSVLPNKIAHWTKRRLSPGTVLLNSMIEKEPVIKRNQEVIVEYKSNMITLRIKGIALQSGFLGDSIKVEMEESSRSVDAVIVDENKVKVVNINA